MTASTRVKPPSEKTFFRKKIKQGNWSRNRRFVANLAGLLSSNADESGAENLVLLSIAVWKTCYRVSQMSWPVDSIVNFLTSRPRASLLLAMIGG
jgi:hypothetical protein